MKKLTQYWIVALLLLGMAPGQSMAETIDVLMVYTPAARDKADYDDWIRGGIEAINAKIVHIISETNITFSNSQLDTRVRLVGRQEIDHDESNDIHDELERLQDYYYHHPSPFETYEFGRPMLDATAGDLPYSVASTVIVALVENNIHIRIFDKEYHRIADHTESELTDLDAITALRQRLDDYAYNPVDDPEDPSYIPDAEWIALATEAIRPTFQDDRMNIVHAWRNEVGADVVGLIVATEAGTVQGVGSMPKDINDFDGSYGFLVSDLSGQYVNFPFSPAYIGMLFAHELGHVMGCFHDKHNAGDAVPIRGWGYGYKFWSGPVEYGTIMATPNLEWNEFSFPIMYFSNPDVWYWGVQTGNNDDANNARLITETTPLVEGYRETVIPHGSIWVDTEWGGYENGSVSYPYTTVAEGIYNVPIDGTIVFEHGSEYWTGTISKPMTITAGIGEMVIGQ